MVVEYLSDINSIENWSPGAKFHGLLVHSRAKIFRIGPIVPKQIGPPDENPWRNGPPTNVFAAFGYGSTKF